MISYSERLPKSGRQARPQTEGGEAYREQTRLRPAPTLLGRHAKLRLRSASHSAEYSKNTQLQLLSSSNLVINKL